MPDLLFVEHFFQRKAEVKRVEHKGNFIQFYFARNIS